MEIIYPEVDEKSSLPGYQLKFHVNKDYLVERQIPNYIGPPMVAINYINMNSADTIPNKNPDIVLASAMFPFPKFDDYSSDYMDQPFVENFSWFKDTEESQYGLKIKKYQVVESPGYPESKLYLKNQKYHDFFIYCGVNALENEDLCIMGKEINIDELDSGISHRVNLEVRFNKTRLSDWNAIEINIENYFQQNLIVIKKRGI